MALPAALQPLVRGRHADLATAEHGGQRVVVKVARARAPAGAALPPLAEQEARFGTGLVVFDEPDPDEVVRCEATALNALAPATPKALEAGIRKEDGRSYVIRPFVEGE